MKNFTHLHVHTHYSFLDGFGKVEDWVKQAKKLGMKSLGISDHGNMCGVLDFYITCKKNKIKPIIGSEFYICKDHELKSRDGDNKNQHILLIAKNRIGYKNLIKLSSISWKDGLYYRPRISFKLLKKYSKGLICTSACVLGYIADEVVHDNFKLAVKRCKKLKKIFGKDFYLEIQPHAFEAQVTSNLVLVSISKKYKIPLVVANDCHYIKHSDYKAHSVLLYIQTKKTFQDKKDGKPVFQFSGDGFYLKSDKEMLQSFKKDHKELYKGFKREIKKGMENTGKIADMCDVKIPLDKNEIPSYDCENSSLMLKKLLKKGWKKKLEDRFSSVDKEGFYCDERTYKKRFKKEFEMIKKMDFCDYFLIVQDIVNWAKKKKIQVGSARGSVAGSLVAYLLNITDMDPIKFQLPFERFLSPDRSGAVNMPDIDIDFEKFRRDEVKGYIAEKYGVEKVAEVITFHYMKSKSVLKDVARVYGLNTSSVNSMTVSIYDDATLDEIENNLDKYEDETGINLVRTFYKKEKKRVWKIAKKLEGQIRHFGIHAAAVVIGTKDLKDYCPVQIKNLSDPRVMTQWNMYDLQRRGLLKIDILGLVTLDIIKDTIKLSKKKFNINRINISDKNIFKMFKYGETMGVFQLERYHFANLCRDSKPKTILDIAIINALGRPGAKDAKQDDVYFSNKRGGDIEYVHKDMKKTLKSTYGAIIFQEQVMEICKVIGCFPVEDITEIRNAIKKSDNVKMRKYGRQFVDNAVNKKKMKRSKAEKLWEDIKTHGRYSFNLSHAMSYSMISYQTMWLKHYYPYEFFCAMLRFRCLSQGADWKNKVKQYITMLKRKKYKFLNPDINKSGPNFNIVKQNGEKKFLKGFLAINGIAEKSVIKIMEERKKGGKNWIRGLTPGIKKKLSECELKY